jgi:hypothetical protein
MKRERERESDDFYGTKTETLRKTDKAKLSETCRIK